MILNDLWEITIKEHYLYHISHHMCSVWFFTNREYTQKTEAADLLSDVNDISNLEFQLVFIQRHIFKQGFALTLLGLCNENILSHSGSGLTCSANNSRHARDTFPLATWRGLNEWQPTKSGRVFNELECTHTQKPHPLLEMIHVPFKEKLWKRKKYSVRNEMYCCLTTYRFFGWRNLFQETKFSRPKLYKSVLNVYSCDNYKI